MNKHPSSTNGWLWLTVPIALLLAIVAEGGVFIGDLYHDTPNLVVQAHGQDVTTPLVALLTLAIGAWLTSHGAQRDRLIWLEALVYTARHVRPEHADSLPTNP